MRKAEADHESSEYKLDSKDRDHKNKTNGNEIYLNEEKLSEESARMQRHQERLSHAIWLSRNSIGVSSVSLVTICIVLAHLATATLSLIDDSVAEHFT